jgi:neutral trehalase
MQSLRQVILAVAVSAICFAASPVWAQTVGPVYTTPPSIEYGELYRDVELASIFPDSKTFPDLIPDAPPATILREYSAAKRAPGFELSTFVEKHFTGPTPLGPIVNPAMPDQHLLDYVASLWPILQQVETSVPAYSTLQCPILMSCRVDVFARSTIGIPISRCSAWKGTASANWRSIC